MANETPRPQPISELEKHSGPDSSGRVRSPESAAYRGTAPPWAPGKTVAHRYELERELGGGAMGAVYLAHDVLLHKQVALKVLRPELAQNRETVHRFLREVALAHSVTHPHIVRIYDTGEESGLPFFTMEYLQGQTLEELLENPEDQDKDPSERLALREIREILFDVLDGMGAAHQAGVVHRDLKPGNVMLTHRGAIVMDFGVAGIEEVPEIPSASNVRSLVRTEAGTVFGSPAYMAPELWEGARATVQSDLYAFGVMAYQMLTGRLPYDAKTPAGYLKQANAGQRPPIRALRRDAPWSLLRLIYRCMANDPRDRPTGTSAATNMLSPLRSGARRRLVALGAIAALVVLIIALVGMQPTWHAYGLPDALAEADLAAAVRSYDVGELEAAHRRLDRVSGRAPTSAAVAFWHATVLHELGDDDGRLRSCSGQSDPTHWHGAAVWQELAMAACEPAYRLSDDAVDTLQDSGPLDSSFLPLAIKHALIPQVEVDSSPDPEQRRFAETVLQRLDGEPSWPALWSQPTRWALAKVELRIALGRVDEARQHLAALLEQQPDALIVRRRAAWLALLTGKLERARALAAGLRPIDAGPAIRLLLEEGRLERAWAEIDRRRGTPGVNGLRTMWCGYAFRFSPGGPRPARCSDLPPGIARSLWGADQPATDSPSLSQLEQAIVRSQNSLTRGECGPPAGRTASLTHAAPPFELLLAQLEVERALCNQHPSSSNYGHAREVVDHLAAIAPQDPWTLLLGARVDEIARDRAGAAELADKQRLVVLGRWRDADRHLSQVADLRDKVGVPLRPPAPRTAADRTSVE